MPNAHPRTSLDDVDASKDSLVTSQITPTHKILNSPTSNARPYHVHLVALAKGKGSRARRLVRVARIPQVGPLCGMCRQIAMPTQDAPAAPWCRTLIRAQAISVQPLQTAGSLDAWMDSGRTAVQQQTCAHHVHLWEALQPMRRTPAARLTTVV